MTTRILFDSNSAMDDASELYNTAVDGGELANIWPCDVTDIEVGDRFFLVDPDEGIYGSGVVISVDTDEYDMLEEDDGNAVSDAYLEYPYSNTESYYIQIEFDAAVPYDELLSWDMLQESEELADMDWTFETSGEELDEDIAEIVESRWDDYIDRVGCRI
ncbi:MAG: hypothetical protein EP343_28160 [Deltaproteobacteria bacterium]|nr:MAG: hypothetical protein EP343_28160 [Deltaproteobacteria bacterium]